MSLSQRLFRLISAWALLGLFVATTSPAKLPVVLLIVPFALLFFICYEFWETLQQIRLGYFRQRRLSKRLGIVLSVGVVLLLVLQSLGQLTFRDVVMMVAIVFLGYLYVGRVNLSLPKRTD